MNGKLEVWLDVDFIPEITRVGTLSHDKGQVRFAYDANWLKNPLKFIIDPNLSLDAAPFYPNPDTGNFGIFLDSSPDRWGQTLMKRRELLEAKDQGRAARTLYAWDFLVGVQDETRQGALRFRYEGEIEFLAGDKLSAPPITSLGELESIARELTNKRIDDLNALRKWISVLVAPGASLGGARPKANFVDNDGSLWIAKFPSRYDQINVAAWEMVTHTLAKNAGINVPSAKIMRFNSDHHTFCIKRFDRTESNRVFYASAMTMLKKIDSENSSYLDIAQSIQTHCAAENIASDLAQLFRRVAFNIAVSNRDDHLRNHGFILNKNGWSLAPAFDMNPNIDKAEHVLNIDDSDNRPDMNTVLSTSDFYGLKTERAEQIVDEVLGAVGMWHQAAQRVGLHKGEIELMESAFDLEQQQLLLPGHEQ
ncbi:type II toxin-antitoxin system HipA family toxin [Sulfuriferula nivalis]|uniref:Toxin HipA n=1 Tax=Sulfuriferula nivalis TaxID=2675298 RepID=A0A809RPQ0_9PROT|nr:type II toxin-antitoxin system HipA family toxin [Sulfuriferula nivalis]BBP00811.1 toxin HipA [Sulfuriferula nivalis]